MYTINYKSYFKILINILFILFISIKTSNADTTINTSAKYALLMDYDTGRTVSYTHLTLPTIYSV